MEKSIILFWSIFMTVLSAVSIISQFFKYPKWLRISLLLFLMVLFLFFLCINSAQIPLRSMLFMLVNFGALLISSWVIHYVITPPKSESTPEHQIVDQKPAKKNNLGHRVGTYLLVIIFCLIVYPYNIINEIYTIWNFNEKTKSECLAKVFKEIYKSRPYINEAPWGSNGKCNYGCIHNVNDKKPYYLEIEFIVYNGTDCNDGTGWMLMPMIPYSIEGKNFLEFSVRGMKGGEIVGISLKDASGTERHPDMGIGSFCPHVSITTDWQECTINLDKFDNVDRGSIEMIGFYVNRTIFKGGNDPQRIDIADFKFR